FRLAKRRRVEPFLCGRIRDVQRFAGQKIRTQRSTYTALDIRRASQNSHGKRQPARHGKAATPLPACERMRDSFLLQDPAVLTKRQIVSPVPGKLVALIKTRKAAVRFDI